MTVIVTDAGFGPDTCEGPLPGLAFAAPDAPGVTLGPDADPAALAAAMARLDGDRDMARRMGEAAHERFRNIFSSQAMAQSYISLYRELLSQ